MQTTKPIRSADDLFSGPGEMNERCRSFPWSSTSLGATERWPAALRLIVRTMMASPFAVNLWCGADKILIYNDAYRRALGAKHPSALGRPGREVWSEIWSDVRPMFDQIDAGGPPVFAENQQFAMARSGVPGELAHAWFTFGLSAVRDEVGWPVAYFNPAVETTAQVMAEEAARRSEARLRDVFAQAPSFMAVLRGPEHRLEFANEAYIALIGGRREIVGRTIEEILPEVRAQGFIALLDGVLTSGQPFVGRETAATLDGRQLFVNFVFQPLLEGDSAPAGVLVHGVDVTEQVQARREVERLLAEAREAAERLVEANERLAEQQTELELQNDELQARTAERE
jgi:PAS domain S-box-containing protein